ncbi:MAG: hypothetical protein ACK56F_27715, partial [bacterium]
GVAHQGQARHLGGPGEAVRRRRHARRLQREGGPARRPHPLRRGEVVHARSGLTAMMRAWVFMSKRASSTSITSLRWAHALAGPVLWEKMASSR